MFDVLKTAHELGMEVVPRTKSFSRFVRLYGALCDKESCTWGIKMLSGGLEDWEIQHLQARGLEIPRPDIIIARGNPLSLDILEVIKPKDPVFFLTRAENSEASFSLLINQKEAVLEGARGEALWRLRRRNPEFRILTSGAEYGKVPQALRRLWARASMVDVPQGLTVVYEGWLLKNGEIEVYDAEISSSLP